MEGQLDLLELLDHQTEVYKLDRLWGVERTYDHIPWWTWRCSCGRDLGIEQRAAYSTAPAAEEMATHHRSDYGWNP